MRKTCREDDQNHDAGRPGRTIVSGSMNGSAPTRSQFLQTPSRRRPQQQQQHAKNISSTPSRSPNRPVNSFSKKNEGNLRTRTRRQFLLFLLIAASVGSISLFLTTSKQGRRMARFLRHQQQSLHDTPPMYSDFGAKPSLVALQSAVEEDLNSPFGNVLRIHPTTLQVLPRTSGHHLTVVSPQNITTSKLWKKIPQITEPPPPSPPKVSTPKDDDESDNEPCQLPHDWMKQTFATCNNLHEQGMMNQLLMRHSDKFLMGSGAFRNVWSLETVTNNGSTEKTVLKTLRMKHDFDKDDLHRHRRDALISERLTGSPHVLNIYGYCGDSAIYQYASSGTLYDAIGAKEYRDEVRDEIAHAEWQQWTSQRKLDVSYQVISAVAALHDIDHDGRPSVAHDDLDVTQFVSTDGGQTFQLSDFNGAPFIYYTTKNDMCPFHAIMRGGKTRAPEEYAKDVVTEKMDIFAMANVLYTIVTGQYPFATLSYDESKSRVMRGVLPPIPIHIRQQHDDPIVQALLKVMHQCWNKKPHKRPSAKEMLDYLRPHLLGEDS